MLEQSVQHEAIALAAVVGLRLSVILLLLPVGLRLLSVIRLGVVALPVSALAVIGLLAVNGRRLGRQLLGVARLLLAVTGRWRRAVAWLLLLAVITRLLLLAITRLLLLAITRLLLLAVTRLLLLAVTRRRLLPIARRWLRRIDGFVVRQTLPRHRAVIAARGAAGDGDAGIGHAFGLHQVEQHGGIGRRQPHAAVRHREPQMRDIGEAVDGVAVHVEEHGVRHRRIVPLLGEVVGVHAVHLEGAVRRVVAGPAGRHRPRVALRAVDRDRHLLRVLVDGNVDIGARGGGAGQRQRRGYERSGEESDGTHR